MTVHGAKGLEAPIVILADATHDPDKVGGTSSIVDLPTAVRMASLTPAKILGLEGEVGHR